MCEKKKKVLKLACKVVKKINKKSLLAQRAQSSTAVSLFYISMSKMRNISEDMMGQT